MNKGDKETALLAAMANEESLNILYDMWALVQRAPTKCVEILMQFKDVGESVRKATDELENALKRFEGIKGRIGAVTSAVAELDALNRTMAEVDEGKVLNRLSRITEAGKQIEALRSSGSLELIQTLLGKGQR